MSLWIYKCNNGPANGGSYYGDWQDCFRSIAKSKSKTTRWGGPEVTRNNAAKKLAESAQVGQRMLCWQRWQWGLPTSLPKGQKTAAVGIVEIVAVHPQSRGGSTWELKLIEEFSNPVPILLHRKSHPTVNAVFRNPRQLATFGVLSQDEERDFLKLCGSSNGGTGVIPPMGPSKKATSGAGFGASEQNKEVERAAINVVTSMLQADGWLVKSRESERVGYDLEAIKGRRVKHVEVKGVRGAAPEFIITRSEVEAAKIDSDWEIWIVNEALGSSPTTTQLSGKKFIAAYRRTPISYMARQST